ncbi:glycosyltransferase WbsX family protein [Propylenella binzhouense]|uniref:Glycosyl transferase family WbsX n=1 Tax=Propylenella binzhouense TaxID=2555902 RepID=A0A964T336_9HYPH|nr:glycoside hydrolase family 99-like domain-containing protein [Propylenella binzhouense]MYZ47057.1 hypothetical protein [Propylenella binzhouense]
MGSSRMPASFQGVGKRFVGLVRSAGAGWTSVVPLFRCPGQVTWPLELGITAGASGRLTLAFGRSGAPAAPISLAVRRAGETGRLSPDPTIGPDGRVTIDIPAFEADWGLLIEPADKTSASDPAAFTVAAFAFVADARHRPRRTGTAALIRASGLFDPSWYARHGRSFGSADEAFGHFYFIGRPEGLSPSFYFDPAWYLAINPDVSGAGQDPLVHFLNHGEREGRRPIPLFDPAWYRETYRLDGSDVSALRDYLDRLGSDPRNPCPEFDVAFYRATYPEVSQSGLDPLQHYALIGYRANYDPSAGFDTSSYVARYLDGSYEANPLVHYVLEGRRQGFLPLSADRGMAGEIAAFVQEGDGFEEFRPAAIAGEAPAKVIALYLPQFHAIPENDAWWGPGFTEWRNLARGAPRFRGHYQPRIPRDLGFYDLSDPAIIRRQTALAAAAGIHGFCFYYYWFNGRRLLERPLDLFAGDGAIDFPFCLMWANENWTRRWDGAEDELLIRQDYREEDDDAFVDCLAGYFNHPRYIRIGGRPLLSIYRADHVPDAAARIERWRKLWRERHGLNPLFLMAQSFRNLDPRPFGLDGALEFPPHKFVGRVRGIPHDKLDILDPGFASAVFPYERIVADALAEEAPPYPLVKTVSPSWDNDARRQGRGTMLHGSTPELFETWLTGAVEFARRNPLSGEPLVFVNAWNEWAEGAYLEPDVHFGSAYLNVVARTLSDRHPERSGAPGPAAGLDNRRAPPHIVEQGVGRWRATR